jgi:SP family sugar:H+ symporter-like MFS transporter
MLGSWVSSHWGRRMCMFSMSIWACVAATIVITSKTRDQILVGRVMNYIYIGMELSVVPIFQGEIVPAQARGFVVGTYQISLFIGGLIMNCVARGTGGFAGPTIVACLIWFVPESPRWLILRGRQEEGLAALRKFRAGKFSEEEIQIEFDKIVLGIHTEVEQGSFVDIFRSGVIKRTVVVIGANFFLQATGQIFTSIYGALFVKSLGTINPFSKCTLQRMDVEAMLTYNLQLLL